MHKGYRIIGHRLCPYVQRVVIAMREGGIPFERTDIDLDDKPDWLHEVSPSGRVPVLEAGRNVWLFESGAIAAFIDRQTGGRLMPADPLAYAQQDAWMRYGDGLLALVARIIYRDPDAGSAAASLQTLSGRLQEMERRLAPLPYFSGANFGLLDAVMASLFRSFAVLDLISEVNLSTTLADRQSEWWTRVQERPSVRDAVPRDFDAAYAAFIAGRNSHAGRVLRRLGH